MEKKRFRFIGITPIFICILLVGFLTFSFLTLRVDSAEPLITDHLYPANVERIIDGDTIVVNLILGLGVVLDYQYLRFYGIDAWETRGEERPKGLLAKEFLIELLEHVQVIIEIRPEWGSQGKGKYGRWLAVVYIAETGINLNELLISEGHAEEATY